VRETLEETGYAIAIDEKSKHSLEYDFHWNGQSYSCSTDFFIGHLLDLKAQEVNDAHYHQGVYWCPLDILPQKLANYPKVLRDFILLACGT
jgi:8-oxo-dGTP pyrophosphatase MutT (NUDIX family)